MAKRELINKTDLILNLATIAKAKAKSDAQKVLMGRCIFMSEKMPVITEEEIVRPYLEKLKEQIKEEKKVEHIPKDVEMWDYIEGMNRVVTLIDNLLTEKGAEE